MRQLLFFILLLCASPFLVSAQQDEITYTKGTVIEITETTYPIVFGNEIEFQKLRVQTEDGELLDSVFNDYTPVSVGTTVYLSEGYNPDTGQEGFFVREINRIWSLVGLFVFFCLVYVGITGIKGLRSLLALALSIAAVWFVLVPMMAAGYNPLLIGVGISIVILGIAIFVTHGVSIVSFASYIGSLIAIALTILFANIAVKVAHISGLAGDESSTLSVLYGSILDLQGVLLAAMIIGILGVLDDIAVMQAAMVREFMYEKTGSIKEVFWKAMRVGQEHAAALVNTLVLAYVAVALPLFLIVLAPVNQAGSIPLPFGMQVSNELFVVELVRSIVGSFGLVITIPIVTAIAVYLFSKFPPSDSNHGHSHGHHHH